MPVRVDAFPRPGYVSLFRTVVRSIALLPLLLAPAACAARHGSVSTPAEAAAAERDAIAVTAPQRPLRILFDWTLKEADASFGGRGIARVEPPYRARVDLFGPRQETVLSAALVDGELRLPAGAAAPLPPPSLLWGTLGVFRPPPGAQLTRVQKGPEETRLEYRQKDGRWRFLLADGRLQRAEWEGESGRQSVELSAAEAGVALDAVYRDWVAFRELSLKLDDVQTVDPFPPEIWTPGAR
ncbi:MAG: hypothetical protein HY561_08045 [Gemmatimonadetes bacterium]|nr:hypothetical protein [Gemmatimonadota bacterium]